MGFGSGDLCGSDLKMAFKPQPSGWTAMSLAPNPELFAQAHNTISGVVNPSPVAPPIAPTAPVIPPPTTAYQNLQQKLFPAPAVQQQATSPSPLQAVANISEQLKTSPWTPKPTAQPQNFLNPTTGQTQPKAQPKGALNGWVSPLPVGPSLPPI